MNHHLEVPFYTLEHQYGFSGEDDANNSETRSGNMIIHGDNLLALKALMPEYEGRVDCIYIDPPYNTGHGDSIFTYNDKSVNKDDGFYHSKWLSQISKRLSLLRDLLDDNGVIL